MMQNIVVPHRLLIKEGSLMRISSRSGKRREITLHLLSDVVLISRKGRFRSMIELSRVWLLDTFSDTRMSCSQATQSLAAASLTIDLDVGQRMNVRSNS